MSEFLNLFSANTGTAISALATVISAAATVFIALLTAFLWFENRRLRKAGNAPELVAYLSPHSDGSGAINFVLANVGKGPAFDVTFELLYDELDFKNHDVMLVNDKDRMPMSVIPQDERIYSLFGISFQLYGQMDGTDIGPLKPFQVCLDYFDVLGKKSSRKRAIDIKQFAGIRGVLAKSAERKIADSMEKIEHHLSTVARQSVKFSAFVDITEFDDRYVKKAKGGE
ncbi:MULTISPECIES: hypothetical protein [unclassified Mesorhizobium]|uniref:hypothetical protein n=1 Tax=unclassified Mesorhizobium TaxID=325217 RepID=UPI001CC95F91|nr:MULTISPECIES: hypothetical protein [unclassified Mesorhizobium]MBZ9920949.1 hypothetical protein [Mesorhizobium sp. BR1-1-7]MBZ9952475.1 hypothetical protein [Mesorhizobium sp. BR1-1-15]MBZ9968297.1 hypothetical protein [Mesorhizobium sp. BR1-1-12]